MRGRMDTRAIGGIEVSAIALGGSDWSIREIDPDVVDATIGAALDAGITLLDTAHVYTTRDEDSHNERLIARILKRRGASPLIATKGGHYREGDAFRFDGRPETIIR